MRSKKDCLFRTSDLEKNIASQLRELSHLRSLSTKMTTDMTGEMVDGGDGIVDRMAECAVEICDLEQEIAAECAALAEQKRTTRNIVNSVVSPRRRMLLRLRYLEGLSWERIAELMEITPRSVYRLHERTLQDLAVIPAGHR